MRATYGNDQSVVRALNRNAVLNTLHREKTLSRVQLRDRLGLSSGAVTAVVAELIQEGLIEEYALGASTGGRPPVMLTVRYSSRAAIGIRLMDRALVAVLTDLGGTVLYRTRRSLTGTLPEYVTGIVAEVFAELLEKSDVPREHLVGLGMGLPGVIDAARGICVHAPTLGWRDVPIADLLKQAVNVPVVVDNDVNAFAAAERLFGWGRQASHLAVVTIGRGIGAGLVVGGMTYRGRNGGAGEIGHVVVEKNGLTCECGKRGCLEAYASEPALLRHAREAVSELPLRDITDLLAAAAHPHIAELLADAGERVGMQLANLVNVFNPEMIVIGGEGVRLGDVFFGALRRALHEHAFGGLADDLPVIVEPWGDDDWVRGAASLAVQPTFDFEHLKDDLEPAPQ